MSKRNVPSKKTWKIVRIGGQKAHEYGTVEAPDADSAVRKAIEKFEVPQSETRRLTAVPRS